MNSCIRDSFISRFVVVLTALLVTAALSGCPPTNANPEANPEGFVSGITNPFMTLTPGTTFVYRAQKPEGTEVTRVAVTTDTKKILEVTCIVVRDRVTLNDALIEDTLDWYAQDTDGNVWYFGEDAKQYENGALVGTAGSWEAGVDGALPGVVMMAFPYAGATYRQEYLAGKAEDMAQVESLQEDVTIPYGSFTGCLKTRDFSPLEPAVVEHKLYAPGVGLVVTEEEDGNSELAAIEIP